MLADRHCGRKSQTVSCGQHQELGRRPTPTCRSGQGGSLKGGCGQTGNQTEQATKRRARERERRIVSKQTTALNQRLGFRAEDRLLIVNCDDVGSSHSANVAALRAMTSGVATSASLMVPCPWAAEAARMFDGLPVGVHLTLTSEHAGYRWRSLTGGASLRDASGFLPATTATALSQQDLDEVRAECRAQVDTALA